MVVCLFGNNNVYGLKNCNCNATNSNFHNTYIRSASSATTLEHKSNKNQSKWHIQQLNETKSKKKMWIKIKMKNISKWLTENWETNAYQDQDHHFLFNSYHVTLLLLHGSERKRRKTARAHQYIKVVDMTLPLPLPLPDSILF